MKLTKIISSVPPEATGMMIHIIHIVMAFIIGVILARSLSVEMFGNYSFILALITISMSLVTAGFPRLLTREIAVYKLNQEYKLINGIFNIAAISVMFFSGLFAVVVFLIYLSGNMQNWGLEIIFAGTLSLFLLSLASVYESATCGLGYVLVGQLSNKVVKPGIHLFFLLILIWGFYDGVITTKLAIYAFTLATFIGFLFASYTFNMKRRNYKCSQKKFDISHWYSGFWRMSFLGWMAAINLELSVILLGVLGGSVDVANYRVAVQVAMLIPFGLIVMRTIQMPVLSKACHSNQQVELQRLVTRICNISLGMALPVLLITLFFAEELIVFLFGAGYVGAATILFILSLGQIVNVSSGTNGLLMIASYEENTLLKSQGVTLILNIILCIILIPRLGAMGAAIASAISLSLMNIYLVINIYLKMGIVSLPGLYK